MAAEMERNLLPANVVPKHYTIELAPDLEAFTFDGTEEVKVDVVASTTKVVLHNNDIEIHTASFINAEGIPVESSGISYDKKEETASIEFSAELPLGEGKLAISFKGNLNFEATDARRAFPCWDEPARKATFDVTLTVPEGLQALGNMPIVSENANANGSRVVRFDTTPIMSTYLVAFVIGEFEAVSGKTKDGIDVSVWTPLGQKAEGEFPLECAIKTLEYFSEFFDEAYPLPKMDMIAIADFAAGAMENWGLVTYRSAYLLYDAKRTSLRDKTLIAYVVCHELAHQWFGNLVTMEWWTHLWLNEGFATWVGWLAVDHMFKDWHIWDRFVGEELERALDLDSLKSSHPIEVECKNSADVNEIFDAISYSKGASVIRMLADHIGLDAFQTGLRAYLKEHKYSNALSSDLWRALSQSSGANVEALMGAWTEQTGFPVVKLSVDASTGTVVGKQQRFLATGADASDTSVWPVPLGLYGSALPTAAKTVYSNVTFDTGYTLANDSDWVKANVNMTGIFRVQYDAQLLQRLGGVIPTLDNTDRYELVSDAFATAKAGYSDTADALRLLKSFGTETSDNIVVLISRRLSELQAILIHEPKDVQDKLQALALSIFSPMAARLGWQPVDGEDHSDAMLRPVILGRAGGLGDEAVLSEARQRFTRFCDGDLDAIHPDMRGAVYAMCLKHDAAGSTGVYDALIALYDKLDAADQKQTVLRSLGASRNPAVHHAVMDFAMGNKVRDQDVCSPIASMGANARCQSFLWAWFQENFETIHKRFYSGSFLMGRIVSACCQGFASEARAAEINAFFEKSSLETDAIKRAIRQSVESVRANGQWLNACRASVAEMLNEN